MWLGKWDTQSLKSPLASVEISWSVTGWFSIEIQEFGEVLSPFILVVWHISWQFLFPRPLYHCLLFTRLQYTSQGWWNDPKLHLRRGFFCNSSDSLHWQTPDSISLTCQGSQPENDLRPSFPSVFLAQVINRNMRGTWRWHIGFETGIRNHFVALWGPSGGFVSLFSQLQLFFSLPTYRLSLELVDVTNPKSWCV